MIAKLIPMAIFDLFSKRQKRLRGEVPEVYIYDQIPGKLRIQIVHIIEDAFGTNFTTSYTHGRTDAAYQFVHKALCREYGVFHLSENNREDDRSAVLNHLIKAEDAELAIDIIEICFKYISIIINADREFKHYATPKLTSAESIEELNERFKEHGVGFQYEADQIIRVDSTFVHAEITKPTLQLLFNKKFAGANDEYLKAHDHYKQGRNKECLTECLKAFESTMKIICKEKGWTFNQNDTANKLIKVCFDNELIPSFTQNQFTSLQNLLISGIPTIRNKVGGHGQGQVPQLVNDGLTRYGLNLAGTNIIFLIEQSGIVE